MNRQTDPCGYADSRDELCKGGDEGAFPSSPCSRNFAPYYLGHAAIQYAKALEKYCDDSSAVALEKASRRLEDAAKRFGENGGNHE